MDILLTDKIPFNDIPLFSELEAGQLKKITSISKIIKYKKNSIIFLSGEPYKGFYIVLKGMIKVFRISPSAKETILHIIRPYDIFADVPLFEGKNYPVNATALENCILLFVPKEEFIQLLKRDINICLKMLAGFAKKMRYLTKRFDELSQKDITNRLAGFIAEELDKNKIISQVLPVLRLKISKSTIALYLGTIPETLSRAFRKLQNDKIIKVEGKKIFILDYERLKELGS